MCGINGFTWQDEALAKKMNECGRHRGPDDEGIFAAPGISFGHRRLSIIDLSEKGHQPMESADGRFVIVYNGEVYNFEDLRGELKEKGHKFKSGTDTEVILAAFAEYGTECLQKFNGMFAFAIWDRSKRELFLARDRVGIKPLYYHFDGKNLIFSSEIKSILQHKIERKLNLEALNIYLRVLYVPAPLTMFEGIEKLEAGSWLLFKDGNVKIKKYWQPSDFTDLANKDEARDKIKELMKDSVRLRLISDRPVGVFLSGGIDSSVIIGLASEITRDKVKTFSVNYDVVPEKFGADAALARQTAKFFNTEHHEFLVTGKDVLENLEKVIYHMDEPVSNATQVSTYLLAKHTREHVVVGLGGDGGDELFGGYERYRLSSLITKFQGLPKILQNTALALIKNQKSKIKNKLTTTPDAVRYLAFMAQKEKDIVKIFNNEYLDNKIINNFFDDHFFKPITNYQLPITNYEKNFMLTDIKSWLVDESLSRTDKMTMAFGLEQRVPILDHRLVELSLKIPTAWKIKGKRGKVIFSEAMTDYLPAHVLNQPKRGWFSPASEWLRTDLKDLAREVLSSNFNTDTAEIFDFPEIQIMLDDHIEKRAYHMNLLWALLHFQLWYKRFNISL